MFPLKLRSELQNLVKNSNPLWRYKQNKDRISTKWKISTKRNAHHPLPSLFLRSKKKKRKQRVKRNFKSRNYESRKSQSRNFKRLSPRSKCYCFSHSRDSKIQFFFLAQPWWLTILLSVPWPLHFESHFSGPEQTHSG